MAKTNPNRIPGRWREGFSLDFHTTSSTFVGDDEYGHPVFDTKRTELGDLLYRLKYKSDHAVTDELADTAADFLRRWNPGATMIIPVPPSRIRPQQPVLILAKALGMRLGLPVDQSGIQKVKDVPELKNVYDYDARLRLLQEAYQVEQSLLKGRKVLLFDDLYRSGATMNAITEALYEKGRVADVFALTITRTRVKS